MGNLEVNYKQRRGSNEAGTEITDPLDFFREFLENNFNDFKPRYDSLPADKKAELRRIFDRDVMRD